MKRTFLSLLILNTLYFASCSNESNKALSEDVALEEVAASADIASADKMTLAEPEGKQSEKDDSAISSESTTVTTHAPKIIRTGSISIQSKDIKKTKQSIDQLIKSTKGYYEQESTSAGSNYTNYNLTIRIPSGSFDSFIQNLEKGDDKISDKSIQAQDVSLQYFDVESRLKSKRSYLERYQKMVASAKSVKELLEIEEQIRQLQEDIDSSEAVLRNLKGQLSYSTLTINIAHADAGSTVYAVSFWSKIKDSFTFGWEMIESIFLGLIGIWPIILIIATSIYGWRKYKNRKKANQ